MNKLRVMTIVGTRPEIIRLSLTMKKLDEYCEHIIVHTGQNYDYELNEIFFKDLDLRKPDYFLAASGATAAETIANVILSVDKLFESVCPDAILVLGDTNSCLSVIPAKRRKIPIFHMEAGNRCFDMRVPEELNRRIVDHTADVNLTYSSIARECLLKEGLPPDLCIKTGSPLYEVINHYLFNIDNNDIVNKLGLTDYQYFLVSIHREENIDPLDSFMKITEILNQVAEKYNCPVIVSTHPRTQKKIDSMAIKFNPLIKLMKPLGFKDYVKLQLQAKAVLSDSGTITEESSILNFPALSLRETGERHEGMEEGAVMMTGLNIERVLQALTILNDQSRANKRIIQPVRDYMVANVSDKVLRIVHSYTDYVKRVTWKLY